MLGTPALLQVISCSNTVVGQSLLLIMPLLCRSRLGCQIIAAKDIDGLRVRIPSATRNFAVDGYVPKPH